MSNDKLPDEEVQVKMSMCGKCGGIVRVAVLHMMGIKEKNEFFQTIHLEQQLEKSIE
jgi:hypothetical protein